MRILGLVAFILCLVVSIVGCVSEQSNSKQQPEWYKYYNMGVQKYNSQEYESAIACFKKVILDNPNCDMAYWYIGKCYLELKDYNMAKEYFKKATETRPEEGWYWYWLGVANYLTESHSGVNEWGVKYVRPESKETDRYFKTAVQFSPNDSKLIKSIAEFYEDTWNDDKAIEYYEKYLSLCPNDTKVAQKVISYYFDHMDYQKALYYLELINKYHPHEAYEQSIRNLKQGKHIIVFPDGSSRAHYD
ncbi:Tetratricopeptide TPR_2 repeat protein [Methanocaldococcus sp. FS406-22]|uniref:tetratricopeptide repeat protein n=1 Tax=Methanocaldococcus sp. (strain FS406-22) TaxID=644281 RepID=UPI0001BF350B|nr:tetratricopeptide repeat protein [Methanocaldococcus sp. FS406-22]ADC69798.1 Tetratricopeptide TPR_2 repeat protein [Methanocaldococcus sp. FS406-22]